MKIKIAILLVLLCAAVHAQDFTAQSSLPPIGENGFYRILLPPEVSSCINASFSNLRITDASGLPVPFITGAETEVVAATEFVPYAIEEKTTLADSCTIIVLRNDANVSINHIHLVIRNAAVLKEAALFGSDDRKTWYALRDKFLLGYIENTQGNAGVKMIDLPASDYAYYKIWINDEHSAPLNIIDAGYYKNIPQAVRYQELPVETIQQENDLKLGKSYVRITLDTLHVIDRISWNISGVPFYQRTASIYTERLTTDKKGKERKYREYVGGFQINSRHASIQYVPSTRTDNLLIVIYNGDNPPLVMGKIKLHQVSRYLVAWLKKNESYTMKFGAEDMQAPDYDLESFRDNIPGTLPAMMPATPVSLISPEVTPQATIFTTTLFVWVAIIVVILVLGIMSVRMIRETKSVQE